MKIEHIEACIKYKTCALCQIMARKVGELEILSIINSVDANTWYGGMSCQYLLESFLRKILRGI